MTGFVFAYAVVRVCGGQPQAALNYQFQAMRHAFGLIFG